MAALTATTLLASRRTALTVATVMLLAGCAAEDRSRSDLEPPAARGGDEPTTPAALAWVAAQHLGAPASATTDYDITDELGTGAVGAELRFPAEDPQSDGDVFIVAVGTPARDVARCRVGVDCVRTGRGVLFWERATPEEDPGNVAVAVVKGDVTVVVVQSGPAVTGDPRVLDLPIQVDDMFAVAADPRVDVTTSREAVDEGTELSYWHD